MVWDQRSISRIAATVAMAAKRLQGVLQVQMTHSSLHVTRATGRHGHYAGAMILPPVGALLGAWLPWTQFLWSSLRSPTWHGPRSLLLLGWPAWTVIAGLIVASAIGLWEGVSPGGVPALVLRLWRMAATLCFGGALAGLLLASSRFAETVGTASLVFGLGSWQEMGSGMVLFLLASGAWMVVAEWGPVTRVAPRTRASDS